jgi:hypothetical protein
MSHVRRDAFQPVSKATDKLKGKHAADTLAQHENQANLPHVMLPGQPGLVQQEFIQQPMTTGMINQTLVPGERVIGEAERIMGTNTLLPPGQHNVFGTPSIQSFEAKNIGQVLEAGIMSDLQNKISQPFTQVQPTAKQGLSGAFQTLPNVLPQNANVLAGQLDTNLGQGMLHPHHLQEVPQEGGLGQHLMQGAQHLAQQQFMGQQGGFQQNLLAGQNPSLLGQMTGIDTATTHPSVLQQQFQHQLPVSNILETGLASNLITSLPQSGQYLTGQQGFEPALLQQGLGQAGSSQFPGTGLHAETAVRQKMQASEQLIAQDLQNLQHKDQTNFNNII